MKKLSLPSATLIVVANMVGAGVFTTSGFALGDLQNPHYVMLAWVVGGIIAICGAYSYGMIASHIAQSGGEYIFLSKNIHPSAGFVAGLVSMTAGFTGAIAYAALTFESYVSVSENLPSGMVAFSIIIFMGWLHSFVSRFAVGIQSFMVYLKVFALLIFITVPFVNYEPVNYDLDYKDVDFSILVFATTVMWVMFSYSGFNAAVYMYEEITKPKKNVPRALLLGTTVTFIIYLLLNCIFVYYVPLSEVVGQANIASAVTESLYGSLANLIVVSIICLALLTSISSMLLIGPRVYMKMSQEGALPKFLKNEKKAVLTQMVLAGILVWVATLRELLSYFGFTLTLSSVIAVSSLFFMKKKSFNKLQYIAPLVYICFSLVFVVIMSLNKPTECIVGVVTIALGLVHYKFYNIKNNKKI